MLSQLLIRRKELGKIKIGRGDSLTLTCDKVTQTPRVFKTSRIQEAIDNISLLDIEEKKLPELIIKAIEFTLKDFFLYMHQTGLYNRQFKFWQAIARISQVTVYKLQKGIINKRDLNVYMLDFCIDPKFTSIRVIVNENNEDSASFREFKAFLDKSLILNFGKLKGILYFTNSQVDDYFIMKLQNMTNASDPISKYESELSDTKEVRLNVVLFKKDLEIYKFEHIYPCLRSKELI